MRNSYLVSVFLVVFLQCSVTSVQASFMEELKKDASEAFDATKEKAAEVADDAADVAEKIKNSASDKADAAKEVFDETKSKGMELLEKFENKDSEDDLSPDLKSV